MKFIKVPNIPEQAVKKVIVSGIHNNIINYFTNNGVEVIKSEKLINVDEPIQYHTDMQVIHLGDNEFLVEKNCKSIQQSLINMGAKVIVSDKTLQKDYPNDIAFNSLIIDKYVVGKIKQLDENIINLQQKGYILIDTKQGYSKCSTAIVNNKAIITSDKSINKSLQNKIDILLISRGDIKLNGYDYGFIGGSCGLVDKYILLFFGNIKKHKNYEEIKSFVRNYGIYIECTGKDKLEDIGGIVQVI